MLRRVCQGLVDRRNGMGVEHYDHCSSSCLPVLLLPDSAAVVAVAARTPTPPPHPEPRNPRSLPAQGSPSHQRLLEQGSPLKRQGRPPPNMCITHFGCKRACGPPSTSRARVAALRRSAGVSAALRW